MASEDGGDEGGPEAGAEGTKGWEGVGGWLGEGVMDGSCEAGPKVIEVGRGDCGICC